MADPSMELPRPIDFEDTKGGPGGLRPRFSVERLLVLGLVVLGALFLGFSAELWPKEKGGANVFNGFKRILFQPSDADEIRQQIAQDIQSGEFEQAKQLANKLVEIDPKTGYLDRGRILYVLKEYPKAVEDFTKALEQDPKSVNALQLRALTHLKMENRPKALEDAAKYAEIEPRDGRLFEGSIYADGNEWDKAIEAFNKAVDADKSFVPTYVQLFQAYLKKEDFEGARAQAKRMEELAPSQSLVLQGDALSRMGKPDEAIAAYDDALGHDPTNATALNNRAYYRAQIKKDLEKAAKDIEGAIDLAGEEPAYVDTRGFIAYMRGNFKAALDDFNKALEGAEEEGADPAFYAEIYFHRGLVHRKLGEPELAQQDMDKAKKLGFEWKEEPEPAGGSL